MHNQPFSKAQQYNPPSGKTKQSSPKAAATSQAKDTCTQTSKQSKAKQDERNACPKSPFLTPQPPSLLSASPYFRVCLAGNSATYCQ